MKKLFVIKIGGNVLDDERVYEKFLDDFSSITHPKILVHGGGKVATKIGEQLGIKASYVKGRRITDEPTRDLVTMVYGGLINKQLVAKLQARDCNVIGLTGADGRLLQSVRRPVKEVDFGFVGDVMAEDVNVSLLMDLLERKISPVIAPLTYSSGEILNTNADTIASVLATALSPRCDVRLIYCFDKKGVLRDISDDSSVITRMNETDFRLLSEAGALADGILPKIENAFAAISSGVKEVLIGDAGSLSQNLTEQTSGTLMSKF